MSLATNILAISGPVLQAWLVVLMLRRGAHRIFRFFFAYTLFAIIVGTAKIVLLHRPIQLFYFSWAAEALYALLGFAALYEVFHHLFQHLYRRRWFRFTVPIIALTLIGFSILWIRLHGPPPQATALQVAIFSAEFTVRLLQMSFFVLIVLLAVSGSDSTRRYGYGIAIGFGIAASGIFASALVFSEFGTKYKILLNFLSPVAYLVAVLIWLRAFWQPEPPSRRDAYEGIDPGAALARLQELRKQVEEFVERWRERSSLHSTSGSR